MSPVIEAHSLTRRLSGEIPVTLVEDVTLQIEAGEFVVVTGPSGSGKSSLLYLLGLLDVPTSGEIWVRGIATSHMSDVELTQVRLRELGFVFQFHFLLPEFTAGENVMLPMRRLGQLSHAAAKTRAHGLLEQLGLGDFFDKLPHQLSGGQSQRVAIARALANAPRVILADEPTGSLDSVSSSVVQNILKSLAVEHGHAVVAVTHDPVFAEGADRVIRLVDGRLTPTEFQKT
jgi:lipoprotein-releasing system ATP-binding protein